MLGLIIGVSVCIFGNYFYKNRSNCSNWTPQRSATARLTHLEGYGLSREGFDKNLHPGVLPTYTGKHITLITGCFFTNVVIENVVEC